VKEKTSDDAGVVKCIQTAIREATFSFSRSAGPGGQNVNKSNTKATLRWNVGTSSLDEGLRARLKLRLKLSKSNAVVISSQKFRSQEQNCDRCRARLTEIIKEVLSRKKRRISSTAGPASNERRLRQKQARSTKKAFRAPVNL
jgi:ribosome-associated protein